MQKLVSQPTSTSVQSLKVSCARLVSPPLTVFDLLAASALIILGILFLYNTRQRVRLFDELVNPLSRASPGLGIGLQYSTGEARAGSHGSPPLSMVLWLTGYIP